MDLIEQLKIYGEAPDTVSVSTVTDALAVLGFVGKLFLTDAKRYLNIVGSVGSTYETFVETL
jgi:hypothetical protein